MADHLAKTLRAWWPQHTDCWPKTKQGVIKQYGAIRRLVGEAIERAGEEGAAKELEVWIKAFRRMRVERRGLPGKQPFLPVSIGSDGMWPQFWEEYQRNGFHEVSREEMQEAMELWKKR